MKSFLYSFLVLLSLSSRASIPNKGYYHSCEYKDRQTSISSLACNIYQEGRGEGIAGMRAVGFVTINRVKSSRFPNTITAVVYQPYQMSWTKDGRSDRIYDLKAWHDSLIVAMDLMQIEDGDYPYRDITEGSLFYHTDKVSPNWASEENIIVKIGVHIFYREDVKK